jgi:hypothetical protein
MKKYIIITLAATAMLSACSSDDVVDLKSGSPIGFSTFIDKPTRGELTTDNLRAFNVYGYRGDNTIFANETVSDLNKSGKWTYQNTQYWVTGSKYNFHAIASEYGNWAWAVSNDSKAKGTIKFNNGGKSGEEDLIYDYDYEELNEIPTGYTVGLSFNHLLSRVKFQFINAFDKDGDDNIEIAVSDVKIKDAYQYGYVEVGKDSDNGITTTNDVKSSNWDVTDATYAAETTPATFTLDFREAKRYNEEKKEYESWYRGTGETKELFMIPYDTDQKYNVTFDLTVIAYDSVGNGTEYNYGTIKATIDKANMLPGYSYVYKMSFNEDSVKSKFTTIKFDEEVTAWPTSDTEETIASSEIKTEED